MQNKEQIITTLESNFENLIQSSQLNANGQAIVDSLICGTILTLIEHGKLETSAATLQRLKNWTAAEAFAAMLDKLPYPQNNDFRASLYKTFLCFHNNGGKIFEDVSRLGAATTEAEIANLRSTFIELITGILDSSIAALPQVQSIDLTEEEQSAQSQISWREVLSEDVISRNRSDAQMAREQFTEGLFEAVDSAARVLTSEPDNVASYDAYLAQAEAILSNQDVYPSIALDYKGHHDLFLFNIIGYRLKPNDSERLFGLLHEVEKHQVEKFLADHTNPDLQYIYTAIKTIYTGSISNWLMHHTNFEFYPALQRTGLENHEAFDIEAIYNILSAYIRNNNYQQVIQICEFLKAQNLEIIDYRMARLISKLISSGHEAAACSLINITKTEYLEVTDPVTRLTLLMQAALKYQVSVVRKLLERGANVDAQRASDNQTVCHLVVEAPRPRGNSGGLNTDKIAGLLSIFETYRANVNIRDIHFKTPLMYTLDRTDRISISIQLLKMGALPILRNDHRTALQQIYDSRFFNQKLALKLVEAGGRRNEHLNAVDFGVISTVDSVIVAIKSQQMVLEKLRFIFNNGAAANIVFGNNNNYLHYSIIYYNGIQSVQVINLLCRAGVNVNAINSNQNTPLALAAQNPNIPDDVIVTLLLNRADPHTQGSFTNTLDYLVNNHPSLPDSLNRLLLDLNHNRELPARFNMQLSDDNKGFVIRSINTILTHFRISNTPFASPIVLNSPIQRSAVEDRSGRNLGKRKDKENDAEGPNARRRLGLK